MFLRVTAVAFIVSLLTVYFIYTQSYQDLIFFKVNKLTSDQQIQLTGDQYLVQSPKCKIPNLKPFNKDTDGFNMISLYQNCSNRPLLSIVRTVNNQATLYINPSVATYYTPYPISCCYSYIKRIVNVTDPDNAVEATPCVTFGNSLRLTQDIVFVKCMETPSGTTVYTNIHSPVTIREKIRKKLTKNKHVSVLCIGIDSVSRLHLARALPMTNAYLQNNSWIEFRGYNKIGDNTFPNLMGILTGMNETTAYQSCNPKKVGPLDACQMIWYDYRNSGFVTAYGEDETKISTFNFLKKGFQNPPTDYYFRPYLLATEKWLNIEKVDGMNYCTGPETAGERVFDLIRGFASAFVTYYYFGFFWMNSFSHNHLGAVSRMDSKIRKLLSNLQEERLMDNTIIFFYSDHGIRFGDMRYTTTGWLEERLPFFFVHLPSNFKKAYPTQSANLISNRNKLTTPYDFYMTLQDILLLSNKNYTIRRGSACPKCQSFFTDMDGDRSCEEAGIEQHWCTCRGYKPYSESSETVQLAIQYVLRRIHEIIQSYKEESKKCAKYKVYKVMSSSISKSSLTNDTYLLLLLKLTPTSVFEATVSVETNGTYIFQLQGTISRLDYYEPHSQCVNTGYLKLYCYCK